MTGSECVLTMVACLNQSPILWPRGDPFVAGRGYLPICAFSDAVKYLI